LSSDSFKVVIQYVDNGGGGGESLTLALLTVDLSGAGSFSIKVQQASFTTLEFFTNVYDQNGFRVYPYYSSSSTLEDFYICASLLGTPERTAGDLSHNIGAILRTDVDRTTDFFIPDTSSVPMTASTFTVESIDPLSDK